MEAVAQGKLRAVFLECSYGSSQPNEFLFGHLTPKHLYAELGTLAECVRVERGAKDTKGILRGVKCVVIHVKDMMLPGVGVPCRVPFSTALDGLGANEPPALPIDLRTQIAAELASLEAEAQLGVELIIATVKGARLDPSLAGDVFGRLVSLLAGTEHAATVDRSGENHAVAALTPREAEE